MSCYATPVGADKDVIVVRRMMASTIEKCVPYQCMCWLCGSRLWATKVIFEVPPMFITGFLVFSTVKGRFDPLTLQIECWFHLSRLCVVNDSNSERYQNAASLQVKKWFKGLGTPKIPSTHFEANDLIAPNYTMKRTTEPTIQKWKLGLKKKDPMLHKDKEWKYNITHYEMMLSE